MCYNISLTRDRRYVEERFDARFEEPGRFKPTYHSSGFSAPFHPVTANEDISLTRYLQWGLILFWTKDEVTANRTRFNAALRGC